MTLCRKVPTSGKHIKVWLVLSVTTNVLQPFSSQRSPSYNWDCTCFARGTLFLEIAPAFMKWSLTLRLAHFGVLVPDDTQWDSCWRKGCWRMCTNSNVVMSNVPNNALLSIWPGLATIYQNSAKHPITAVTFHFKTIWLYLLIKCNATYYCDESSFKKF